MQINYPTQLSRIFFSFISFGCWPSTHAPLSSFPVPFFSFFFLWFFFFAPLCQSSTAGRSMDFRHPFASSWLHPEWGNPLTSCAAWLVDIYRRIENRKSNWCRLRRTVAYWPVWVASSQSLSNSFWFHQKLCAVWSTRTISTLPVCHDHEPLVLSGNWSIQSHSLHHLVSFSSRWSSNSK